MMIKRIPQLISKKIDRECIVLNVEKGLVHELNPAAELIWKYVYKPRSIEEITEKLIYTFGIKKSVAKKDVLVFIKRYKGILFIIKD